MQSSLVLYSIFNKLVLSIINSLVYTVMKFLVQLLSVKGNSFMSKRYIRFQVKDSVIIYLCALPSVDKESREKSLPFLICTFNCSHLNRGIPGRFHCVLLTRSRPTERPSSFLYILINSVKRSKNITI